MAFSTSITTIRDRLAVFRRLGRGDFWSDVRGLAGFVLKRFDEDRCLSQAASLSYTTLLSLVPLVALAVGVVSAFPAFAPMRQQLQAALVANLLPQASNAAINALSGFIANAGKATGAGILGLAVTSILLLGTINSTFHTIWRANRPRPFVQQLLVYWAILTLGPLIFGAALSISGVYLPRLEKVSNGLGLQLLYTFGIGLASILLEAIGFGLLYRVAPNRSVSRNDAVIGGLSAAVLFEAVRLVFALYLDNVPTFRTIYGTLAAVPIFLTWMYCSWVVALLGAELVAALPEWRQARAHPHGHRHARAGERLAVALAILARLEAASYGELKLPATATNGLVDSLGLPVDWTERELRTLHRCGLIAQTTAGFWVLTRDLASIGLFDLLRGLEIVPDPRDIGRMLQQEGGWPARLSQALGAINTAGREANAMSVKEVLALSPPAQLPAS